MTSRKVDYILLCLGVALIFISSYQLFLSRFQNDSSGLSLGTLIQTQSVVKIKNSLALDWRDAYSGSEVSESQLIYTDDEASAEVKFTQGHRVQISENSLIRLATLGKGINVERGLIRAKLSGNEPLVIEMNGSELTLKGDADIQINLQGEKGEIGVISGQVDVEKDGAIEKLNEKTALSLEGDELKKQTISFTLESPWNGSALSTLNERETVNFKWSPAIAGKVTLSRSADFKTTTTLEGEGQAVSELSPGNYFWKVSDENGASLVSTFTIIKEVPPLVLRPKSGEKIRLSSANPKIFLQWKGKAGESYLVDWEQAQERVQTSGYSATVSGSGPFRWRVKLDNEARPLAQWSEWQELDVTVVEVPTTPIELMPENLELQSYSKEAQTVELSWKATSPVELVVIAPNGVQNKNILNENSYQLAIKDPGQYRWRVRGIDEFERGSEWSEWKSFTLEDLSHEVSAEGFQRVQLKKPDQSVTFNWKAQQGTNTVFELSDGKDFSNVIIKKEVTADEVKVVVPKPGEFYWRSRQYRPDGSFEVSEPKKVIIEPAPAPTKPEKLPDLEVPLEWKETKVENSWLDFIISSAHADEFKGVARISLPANEDVKKYVVRIYRDGAGTDLVLEKTIEGQTLEWSDVQPGQYFWQYAVIDFWDRQSPFSDLSLLNVVGTPPVLPEKVKLRSPIRAAEVEKTELEFKWTESEKNSSYRLEISDQENFSKILHSETTKDNEAEPGKLELSPGLHYWRIISTNETKKEVLSNTGRFTIKPPLERIVIVDQKAPSKKLFRHRLSLAWAPSSDTFDFEGDDKGKIDGTTMNSVELRGHYFHSRYIFNADLLRQSGEVFEGEQYLFQRLLLGGTWKKVLGDHLWGPGLSVGHVSGYAYEVEGTEVTSSSVSGLVYGPHIAAYWTLSAAWEMQTKASYLLGAIPHLEVNLEANRTLKNFYLVMGVSYASRTYEVGEGTQTSMRLSLGIGKEF